MPRIDGRMLASKVLSVEALAFVYGLAFLVGYGLLTSRINMRGLLLDKSGPGGVRPERVQLMLTTMAVAAKYLIDLAATTTPAFPRIDPLWLYLLGSSHGIYISRKAYERFWGTPGKPE
jgi:hypothetical protein